MASPPIVSPGGSSGTFNYENWEKGVEAPLYQKMAFIPRIRETDRLYAKRHIRKSARLPIQTLSQSSDGTGLTYSDPIGPEVTLTPTARYVGIGWSEAADAQTDVDFGSEEAGSMEDCLAEGTDQAVLLNVSTLTSFLGDGTYYVDAAGFRNAVGKLGLNTSGMITPDAVQIHGILHGAMFPALMSIPEFTHADIRGDGENALVKGIYSKGGGVMVKLSNVVQQDAGPPGVAHGCFFHQSAFVISWNRRSKPYRERVEAQHRVILLNNFGSNVLHDARAFGIRTANVIPG